jgi:hypothetical protein
VAAPSRRGGGCSFGIKVINAQKLGAAAVIIVNTDDKKVHHMPPGRGHL